MTRSAGSVTISVPILISIYIYKRPYSINVTPSFIVSINFKFFSIIGNLLLQNADTDNFSHTASDDLSFIRPIEYLY